MNLWACCGSTAALTEGDAALADVEFEGGSWDGVAVAVRDHEGEIHGRDARHVSSARNAHRERCQTKRRDVMHVSCGLRMRVTSCVRLTLAF